MRGFLSDWKVNTHFKGEIHPLIRQHELWHNHDFPLLTSFYSLAHFANKDSLTQPKKCKVLSIKIQNKGKTLSTTKRNTTFYLCGWHRSTEGNTKNSYASALLKVKSSKKGSRSISALNTTHNLNVGLNLKTKLKTQWFKRVKIYISKSKKR